MLVSMSITPKMVMVHFTILTGQYMKVYIISIYIILCIYCINYFIKGQWVNDVRQGFGKYTYANGDIYEGEWESNMKQGQGTYTFVATGTQVYNII